MRRRRMSRAEELLAHPLAGLLGSATLQAETERLLGEDPGPRCSEALALGLAATTGLESVRQHVIWVVVALAIGKGPAEHLVDAEALM